VLYSFENFTLDTSRRILLRGEEAVPLTPRIFDTLVYLV